MEPITWTAVVGAILGFARSLPDLVSIYNNILRAAGKRGVADMLKRLDESTDLMAKAADPALSMDERRKIRREALAKSADVWAGISPDGV